MNALTLGMVLTGVILNAGAQLLLKAGTNVFPALDLDSERLIVSGWRILTEPHIVGGLLCYVLSVAIWIAALARVEVSVAYPMLSIGYVVNALAAWILFGELLSAQKIVGILVIIVGVFLVARS